MRKWIALGLVLGLAQAACGGGEDDVAREGGTEGVASALLSSRNAVTSTVPFVVGGEPLPGVEGAAASSLAPGPAPAGAPEEGGGASIDIAVLGHTEGAADAPVRVVEFSDFGCGYCRQFHNDVFPSLREEYMETGKVQWKFIPMILGMFGPNSVNAAHAGECALEQGHFPGMRDALFARQSEWKRASDPQLALDRLAEEQGLDMDRWHRCVAEGWRQSRIDAGTRLSREVGVRGTPTFFVVGYAPIPGAIPLEVFRQVLDTVYARSAGVSGGGDR